MQKTNIGADILPIYRNQIGAFGKKRPMWSIVIKIKANNFKENVFTLSPLKVIIFLVNLIVKQPNLKTSYVRFNLN